MDILITLFGEGKDLSSLQMGMRAAAIFLCLATITFAGGDN
jgi:hypothetical protein